MRGSCIEIAKNAPSKRTRLARLHRRGGQLTLKTPRREAAAARAPGRSLRSGQVKPAMVHGSSGAGATVPASRSAKNEGRQAGGMRDMREAEAEADAIEVKDALDESGAAKITQ
jgi:hypothetical protein